MLQMVPAPRNPRQMLRCFALYDPASGLPGLLNRLDLADASRRQLCFATLGRPPDGAAAALDGPDFSARKALSAALTGDEFQLRIREILLHAFPEKRRLVFVHIPKCAGSDLLVTLQRRYPYVHHHLSIAAITDKPGLFAGLQRLACGLDLSDAIAVSGHVPLRWYRERALLRFEDELFTTVRHPRDMLYSYVSFILTRCVEFRGHGRRDVRNWLSHVGLQDVAEDASPAYLAELGGRLLRTPAVTSRSMICNNLGSGTAASAIEAMVLTDIEITDTERYSAWRSQRFGFEPPARVNMSRPYFTAETASSADRAVIDEMIAEDMVVYEAVRARLASSDALSVRGRVFG